MRVLLAIAFCLSISLLKSQDLSLSQYHLTEALINPASCGNGGDNLRATLAHKRQWGAVSSPFITSYFSVEWTPTSKAKNNIAKPSFGLIAITDKAGTSGYNAGIYKVLAAYKVKLNRSKSLSFGLEVGYNQRNFNLDGLAWDSQYNGVAFDPTLPTLESYNATTSKNIDTGFGVEFTSINPRKLTWSSGLAFHHYYQQQSVLENGEDALPTLGQLYFKGTQTNGSLMYRYYALFQSQNLAAYSGTLGADVSYRFNYDSRYTSFSSSSAITAGVFYRYRDAIIAQVGYEYKRQFRLSISYDFNTSGLRTSSNLNGGPEINLTYFANFGPKRRRI